jgi:hypothetical protein
MLNQAQLSDEFRNFLWAEYAKCATQSNNIIVKPREEKSLFKKFYKRKPQYEKGLKTFGEMCVIFIQKNHSEKLEIRGDLCIFVSSLEDHGFDVYQLFNMDTKKIVESRDVR